MNVYKKKGLIIDDYQEALRQICNIGYFRLANYWHSMESDKIHHIFKPNSHFSNSVDLYFFDQELRSLLFSSIQNIEIAFRAKLMHETAMEYGAFWILNQNVFNNLGLMKSHLSIIFDEVNRSKEDFINEYFNNYDSPELPPVWKTMEVLSFGLISKLYQNLKDTKLKKRIARSFSLPQHIILESWLKSLSVIRNLIAHHARIWNRNFPQMPKLPSKLKCNWVNTTGISTSKLYASLCCIAYLLDRIEPRNDFPIRLQNLLHKHGNVDIKALGIPAGWYSEPLWKR